VKRSATYMRGGREIEERKGRELQFIRTSWAEIKGEGGHKNSPGRHLGGEKKRCEAEKKAKPQYKISSFSLADGREEWGQRIRAGRWLQ